MYLIHFLYKELILTQLPCSQVAGRHNAILASCQGITNKGK